MTEPMTVAVVGTGRMGGAMVGTLRRAGFPVRDLEPHACHRP